MCFMQPYGHMLHFQNLFRDFVGTPLHNGGEVCVSISLVMAKFLSGDIGYVPS